MSKIEYLIDPEYGSLMKKSKDELVPQCSEVPCGGVMCGGLCDSMECECDYEYENTLDTSEDEQ